jgi:hypothetical protein
MSSDRYEARAKQIVKFAKENEPVARASSEMARNHIGNLFGEELPCVCSYCTFVYMQLDKSDDYKTFAALKRMALQVCIKT